MTTLEAAQSARPRRRLPWRSLLLIALVVAAIGAAVVVPRMLGTEVAAYRVVRSDLVQTVVASGLVAAPNRVQVGTPITGIVSAIPVSEGQRVEAGDLLVQLDDTEARAGVVQAHGAVAQAEARLRQLREVTLPAAEESLRQADVNLTNARQSFERTASLLKGGYASKATYDDAQKALNLAEAQQRAAALQVYTNRPGGSDQVMAETQLQQAEAALAAAKAKLDYTSIEAPDDGTLIARDVERGNVVQPGKVLMQLAPTGDTEIVVQIDERNLGLLAIGQSALASADAYPARTFEAVLAYINPGIDSARGSVEVKLKVPNPPDYLREDMTVSVDIEVARRGAALVAPADAVRDAGSTGPFVYTVVDGRVRKQPVTLGARGDSKVEILEGVAEGDTVLPSMLAVVEGQKVRPVLP